MQKMLLQDEKIADMVKRLQSTQDEVKNEQQGRTDEVDKIKAESDKLR